MSGTHNFQAALAADPGVGPGETGGTSGFRPALVRYFSRRVNDPAEVEDLVHEVLVRLLGTRGGSPVANAQGYVFQTARSVLVDWLRKRDTHRAQDHLSFDVDSHGGEDFATDRVLMGKEDLQRAASLLRELPVRARTVFVLRQLEGMPYADIATRLGVSLSTVEKEMNAALRHLNEGMRRT